MNVNLIRIVSSSEQIVFLDPLKISCIIPGPNGGCCVYVGDTPITFADSPDEFVQHLVNIIDHN